MIIKDRCSFFLSLLIIHLMLISCSKTSNSPTTVKLKIAGLATLANGVGAGGGVLFGRSLTGESFGYLILNNEENIELPNGDWTFFATMWDSSDSTFNGQVYCGRSTQKLTGVQATVAMTLTNGSCADPEFSGGKIYSDGNSKFRFANIFVEDCDDVAVASNVTCLQKNQGNALSYRLVFQNYKRGKNGGVVFLPTEMTSACRRVNFGDNNDVLESGLKVNFPSGNGFMPFVVSIEAFLGNDSCNPDSKGVFRFVLNEGLGFKNLGTDHKVVSSNNSCVNFSSTFFSSPSTYDDKKSRCIDHYGTFSGSCNTSFIKSAVKRFSDANICNATSPSEWAIKHTFSIPKSFICDRYEGRSDVLGTHPFAAGDGSFIRPYKICNEWQLNQIGEENALSVYQASFYKLLNNLDMNKTDFGPYAKPRCAGVGGSLIRSHTNFNPLGKLTSNGCTIGEISTEQFSGDFNGNDKTIRNLRLNADEVNYLGFARTLYNGSVRNLNLKNLEVEGKNRVGAIAGHQNGGYALVNNVTVLHSTIQGRENGSSDGVEIGGLVGVSDAGNSITDSYVIDSKILGREMIGGLVGYTYGSVLRSSFSGLLEGNNSTGYNVGGIAGSVYSGALVSQSFSEGIISTKLPINGGITGSLNGTISNSYSTMMILNYTMSPTNYSLGGIVGNNNTGGVVNDSYYDGYILPAGTASGYIDGVVANNSGGGSVGGNSWSTFSPVYNGGALLTYAALRDGTRAAILGTNWSGGASGQIPRLNWESERRCNTASDLNSVSIQLSNGRGSLLNPVIVCNVSQLSAIDSGSVSDYFLLAEDLNLTNFTNAQIITAFNSNLLGNNRLLFGLGNSDALNRTGIIRLNNGIISNLKLAGFTTINTNASPEGVGSLVGVNYGQINKVKAYEVKVSGKGNVGSIVGKNFGELNQISSDKGSITANFAGGGIVGLNMPAGKITRTLSSVFLSPNTSPSSFNSFGGIAGINNGILDQVEFSGKFNTSISSSVDLKLGGIAGFNEGTIKNSLVSPVAKLEVKNSQKIGGIAGENTAAGVLSKSIFTGKLIYNNGGGIASASQDFNPVSGNNLGVFEKTFFLKDTVQSLRTTRTVTTCTGGVVTVNSAIPGDHNYVSLKDNEGSDKLPIFFSISTGSTANFAVPSGLACSDFTTGKEIYLYTGYNYNYTGGLASSTGELNSLQMKQLTNFCNSFSAGQIPYQFCIDGLDIALVDDTDPTNSPGYNRVLNFYLSLFDELPAPSSTPRWVLEKDGEYPKLLQLDE